MIYIIDIIIANPDFNEMHPVVEVLIGAEPNEWHFCRTELRLQALKEDQMVNQVEHRRQIKTDEHCREKFKRFVY